MPLEFKKMLEHVLGKKGDITMEGLKELIEEKKRKIGAGYLTDQGALFLVAADLGISFENAPKADAGIRDLFVGAKDVNLAARVLSVYPIRIFTKRDSVEKLENRTLTVYDQNGTIRLRLWNKLAHIPDELQIKPGDVIKIINGYVKSGLDGKPVVNLGEFSSIEKNDEESSIPNLDSIGLSIDQVTTEQDHIVISGILKSNPRIMEFSDSRGAVKKSLQAMLSNDDSSRSLRLAIWNVTESNIPRILKLNSNIRIVGARIKQGNPQYGNGDLEIHGDEGTVVETDSDEKNNRAITLRLLSEGRADNSNKKMYYAIDEQRNLFLIMIENDLISNQVSINSVIQAVPNRVFGNSLIFSHEGSHIEPVEDKSIPMLEESITKIRSADTIGQMYILEAIVLQQPNASDVSTRNGSLVSVADTLVGDDTAEIRLVGWRENSNDIANLKVGERIRLTGAILTSGRDGRPEITMRKDTLLTTLS
jgi:replication factor A1